MSEQEGKQQEGASVSQQYLDTHLSQPDSFNPSVTTQVTSSNIAGRVTRNQRNLNTNNSSASHLLSTTSTVASGPASSNRRPARKNTSTKGTDPPASSGSSSGTGRKRKHKETDEEETPSPTKPSPSRPSPLRQELTNDRKGKQKASRSLTPPTATSPASGDPSHLAKRARNSVSSTTGTDLRYSLRRRSNEDTETAPPAGKSKGKAPSSDSSGPKGKKASKDMSKKANPRQRKAGNQTPTHGGAKKGDTSTKQLIDDPMDDDANWMDEPETSRSRFDITGDAHNDEHMDESEHGEDEDNSDEDMHGDGHFGGGGGMSELARHARESGLLDEATAAALFGGGGFRVFGGMMSGLSNRFRRLRNELRSRSITTRLSALRECSELLLVSNEDTLGGAFSIHSFATEFIAILKGTPNIDDKADQSEAARDPEDMDEDAQLAAVLAMSAGGALPPGFGGDDDEMECQLVACRCLAHLLEALPGSGQTLVHLGAVPVLCSKLNEITYIELAEQTLSTLEKISAECPSAIVKEGGLAALLNFLPFFSTNVQRTAVTAAANCCRNISSESFAQIRDVFPILREVLTQADQRLVEQATLAVVRTIESYKHNAAHLEGLLDVPIILAVNSLLMPSGGSPLLSASTYTHLLRALTTSARGSAKVAIAFLEAGMTNTVYQILTGVLPSSDDDTEQGGADEGQGLAGGVADMAVLQNLAHRPKDQVEESLALICELLPPLPRNGVFDPRSYSEKSLSRIKRGRKSERSDRSTRRSTRAPDGSATPSTSAGPGTPAAGSSDLPAVEPTPIDPAALAKENAIKQKKEQELQQEQRMELFKAHPDLLSKFIKAILPVLVDVYAASVATRVRTKVLNGLTRAVAFSEPEQLRATLRTVPMASFLCAIISSRDHPTFTLQALQLVELLATKLPDVYQVSFQREGVVYEIEALAAQELTTAKSSEKDAGDAKKADTAPSIAGPSSASHAGSAIPDDLKPILEAAGMTGGLSTFLMDIAAGGIGSSSPRKSSSSIDLGDANILRARCLIAKKIFSADGEEDGSATAVLDEIAVLVRRLCVPEASDGEIRDTLREIAKYFTAPGQALSSFELLKSGLVDGLLEFVDIDGTVNASERRAILFDVLSDTSFSNPSPLTLLVKRLHEALGKLEDFQVETAFNGAADSSSRSGSSGLSRTIRVRLQAEEGQDIPKHMSAISVTIQAIAPLQALHDYLRPRVADTNYVPGGGLSSMFAAFASGLPAGSGPSGSRGSRLFDALNSLPPATQGQSSASGAGENPRTRSSAEAAAPGTTPSVPAAPARRRSARLSGLGVADTAELPSTPAAQISQPLAVADSTPQPGSAQLGISPEATIFPSMPMDMDFDDDEGFSEDDYDAEVFEEDMEEELGRPQEKVVNMSVAPDGSRVEAKTPEGTRIATPSQAAGTGQAGPSGIATSRTGSYAGAVKTVPSDFHLEFTHNGQVISLDDTIYGAVHKHRGTAPGSNNALVYGTTAVFKFRKVDGPVPSSHAAANAPSPASVASALPAAFDPTHPTSKILRLLRVLHGLSADAVESTVDPTLFINNKLTAKLTRQLEEIMIIASNCLPEWAVELPKHFSFLFPFETRYSFLQSTSFGYGRLIAKSQSSQNSRHGRNRDDVSHLARIVRQKVRISRSQLLESCAKVLELYGTSSGILEVEYFDEIGTGLGPTLEFYSIASKEFARKSLGLWRDEDESKPSEYVFHPRGLYPAPVRSTESAEAQLGWYKTLGLFTGRALLDSRIIDVNLNKVFLKLILGRPVKRTISNLKLVDMGLARSLERLQNYVQTRKEIEALKLPAGARRNKLMQLTVSGAKLADLSLDFTLPGYDIELKPGGKHIDVDDHNIEEYLELVLDMTLGGGIARQVKAFQEGFSMIFSIDDMRIFSPEELGLLFGNTEEDWSKETLEHTIKADHGYNLDSRSVQNLVEVMSSYDKEQRRQFLQFITGAPKLPIGGFRGLNPPFTVVRKPHEPPFRADDYLPSVMTCAQYLKLPDYSSKEVLAAQIQRAMLDGGGSFHLS